MQVLLIRHGETAFNRQGRFCGLTDTPLSSTGMAQAHNLRRLMRHQHVDYVYSSPLRRARQTARIVFGRRRILVEPALREVDFGKLEGLSVEEVKARFPAFYRNLAARPAQAKAPEGESVQQCRRRAWRFLKALAANQSNMNKVIALVTHGGPIKMLVSYILGLRQRDVWKFWPEPASVTVLGCEKGRFFLVARTLFFSNVFQPVTTGKNLRKNDQ